MQAVSYNTITMSITENYLIEQYLYHKNLFDDYSGRFYKHKSDLEKIELEVERLKGWVKDCKERMEDAEAEMDKLKAIAKENNITL